MLVHLCDVVLESVHNGEHALAWAMSQVVRLETPKSLSNLRAEVGQI